MQKRSFTLVELIAVVVIISMLAALVMGSAQIARKKALVSKARAMISSLELSISMYHADMGDYPEGNGATMASPNNGNAQLYLELTTDAHSRYYDWQGPYMEFNAADISGGKIMDPWSNQYQYVESPILIGNTNSFNLWSYGPEGTDAEQSKWSTNW
ncbi:MAG: type II secretion system protein GspG [Candidatus Omnitrophica bacterium]|nr:type II secretion system protein GspG [Candidatus Omnitrophota bacterium]